VLHYLGILTQFFAAFGAGFFMATTVAPFDMVRTRLMNQPPDAKIYNGFVDCVVKVMLFLFCNFLLLDIRETILLFRLLRAVDHRLCMLASFPSGLVSPLPLACNWSFLNRSNQSSEWKAVASEQTPAQLLTKNERSSGS
jgi:hypothetical protein